MNKDYDDDYYNEYVAINPSSIYCLTKEQMRALLDGRMLADPWNDRSNGGRDEYDDNI